MARPRAVVDTELLRDLCAIHCTLDEISSILKVHKRTLERRFAVVMADGRNHGKMSLRRKRYSVAMEGNVPMLIWLSKQVLGESEKIEERYPDAVKSKDQTDALAATLTARIEELVREKEAIQRAEIQQQLMTPGLSHTATGLLTPHIA